MNYAEREDRQFPGQAEFRARARKRNLLTQIAMLTLGTIGAVALVALLYFIVWLVWVGAQTAADQANTYIDKAATERR